MAFRALPPQAQLKELFDYNPDTGILLNRRLSKPAGWIVKGGNSTKAHRVVKIQGIAFTAQRIIWMWVHGEDPGAMLVDHIDQDGLNNKLENLRLATRKQNRENSKPNKNNSSGYKGVYRMGKKWQARLMTGANRSRSIGVFETPEAAAEALRQYTR